jgi:predicted transcriptional regulator
MAEGTGNDELERLAFLSKVSEGLRQAEAGKVISHEEVKRRFVASRLDGQVDRTTPGPQL